MAFPISKLTNVVTFWLYFLCLSLHINYTSKKGKAFWGLTSGKEKCYWPVKSLLLEHAEPDSQFSVCCYLLKGHFLASVRRSPSIVYLSPFFCLLSKEKLAILENLFAITPALLLLSKCTTDQTLPTNKDKCAMYSITAKQKILR